MNSKQYLVLFVKLVFLTAIPALKLNVPRVLLPVFNDFSSTFTLEATEGGCYKWSTTRTDIIDLKQQNVDSELECSSAVVVSTVTKERARNIAVVLAEDVHTNQILRCDVIVEIIDSLAIVTTTRELFMDEAPEAFEVRAYDSQGNEFSTLEGIEFNWSITSSGSNKDSVMVRFIQFKDSPYETPATMEKLEQENKRGHIVLLEGFKTGSSKVTVKLPQEEYSYIGSYEVQLSVVANLIIHPADVYIMVGDTIKFRIMRINNGKLEEIELPNSQYYLDVENRSIASINKDSGEVTGQNDGKTRVILYDQNVDERDVGLKLPSAVINVVTPAYMTLSILPYRNWEILLSEHHDIVAEVYSSNDHKLHLGEGVEIQIQVGDLFHIKERSLNGSWLVGWAVKEGSTSVQGVLKAVVHSELGRFDVQPGISAQAELLVFPRIILSPKDVILPWDPQLKPKYEVQITATGGDGKFLWSSSNHSIGVVTQTGLVRTHFYGYFEVSASMMKNHHNRENTGIHILPPTRLQIVQFIMEAEVGAVISLHVALYANKPGKKGTKTSEMPFSECQNLPFKVKTSDANFIYNKSAVIAPVGISCANIGIVGLNVGTSKVTVTYYSDGKALEDSVTVSTFRPLHLLYPRSAEIVLAVGTSVDLTFTGGPRPILGRPSSHKRIISSSSSSTVEAQDVTESNKHAKHDTIIISVLCLKLGTSEVVVTVTNSPLASNCRNQESFSTVTVICGKPRSILLQPEIKVADIQSCPMDLSADRIVVQNYKNVELDVAVMDEHGRRFLNVSSLRFDWEIGPFGLGELGNSDGVFTEIVTAENGIVHANRTYQVIKPRSKTGIIQVTVAITGYKKDKLREYGITPEWPEFLSEDEKDKELLPIATRIHLYLVGDTIVKPNVVSVYNHPGNKRTVTVEQGSGYYEIALSESNIADVKYLEGNREIEIIPISDGELKISLIDLCLVSQPAVISISVVSVSILRVEIADKVEIGRCISCIVRLYDDNDNLLAIPDISMIDLKSSIDGEIAKVVKSVEDKKKPWPLGEIHYVVTGKALGETKLSFSIGETISTPIDLQVFPPLRIFPKNTTLLIGSTLQFSSTGGPQQDCIVEYTASQKNTADVSSTGLAQGLALGHTRVRARATGINPTTGQHIIYAEDATDLEIIPLTGIKISIPLSRFSVDATVPAWVSPLPERLSPMILGSVQPPIRFEWDVDDSDVVSIQGPFTPYGIKYTPEDDLSIHVTGLKAGKTRLHLNTVVPGAVANRPNQLHVVYSTSVDIEVFESLMVTYPRISTKTILMAPHSSLQLETNMDVINKVQYSLSNPDKGSEEAKNLQKSLAVSNPIITLSESGLIQSHNHYGKIMVFVFSSDEYGLKQAISLIVEIKPIHYMVVNVLAKWKANEPSPLNYVPLGAEFELKATYHDNVGARFTAGSKELKLRSNRFDLIRVRPGADNSSVFVSLRKPGQTLLKVWADGYRKTVEYIKLHVGQSFSPIVDHVTTGDVICVWTPLISEVEEDERWSSSESSLVSVDGNTGVGQIASVGGGQVAIGHSLHPSASLQLQVVPANKIKMLPVLEQILTNIPDMIVYRVPLVLLSEKSSQKTRNLLNGKQCQVELQSATIYHPFSCHIDFTNNTIDFDIERVFRIQTGFDVDRGQYTCDLFPEIETSPNISTIHSNVSIWTEIEGGGIEADPVELQFIPGIYVERELILSEPSYMGILYITGLDYVLDKVTVKPIDKSLLHVSNRDRPEQNLLTFEIRLLDYHWKLDELGEPMTLKVHSQLTNQIVKVHVKTHSVGEFRGPQCPITVTKHSPLISFFYNYRQIIAIVISVFIIFCLTFYGYARYINPIVSVNIHPNRSLLNASQSPHRRGMSPHNISTTMQYMQQRSPSASPINRSASYNRELVYGDPSSFYTTSAELRRNRRIM